MSCGVEPSAISEAHAIAGRFVLVHFADESTSAARVRLV
jgi:hypothetical protein